MINLNRQRIAVYFYFFIVLTLIFSLSFAVQGNRITGSVVFETAGNIFNNFGNFGDYFIDKYFGKINLLQLNFLIIGILSTLVLTLFIIRYIHESEFELNLKLVASFAIILLVFGVLFFGVYFGVGKDKITGYIAWTDLDSNTKQQLLEIWTTSGKGAYIPNEELPIFVKRGSVEVRDVQLTYGSEAAYRYGYYLADRDQTSSPNNLETESPRVPQNIEKLSNGNLLITTTLPTGLDDESTYTIIEIVYPKTGDIIRSIILSEAHPELNLGSTQDIQTLSELAGFAKEISVKKILEIDSKQYIVLDDDSEFELKDGEVIINGALYTYNKESNELNLKFTAAQREDINKLTQQAAKELTNNLLNLLLGEFAYDQVSQVCKEDWESSEPASDTPRTASSGIVDPLQDGVNENGLLNNCPQSLTTVTAQAAKTNQTANFLYKTSYTINPCKQSITYTVYMANSVDDRIGLESGAANKAKLISNSKHFTYPINYSSICIQVSDTTIGDNGYSCFDIV